MHAFESLSARGQIGRLRRLAEAALANYDLLPSRLEPLAYLENTIFRVEAREERFVLRIHRTTGSPFHPVRTQAEIESEAIWLFALRDAALAVPEPLRSTDGAFVTTASARGVSGSRLGVLFRWEPGRFLDEALTPAHLERVGAFVARLHERYLEIFHGLWVILLIPWFVEQRDHPLFSCWEEDVDDCLRELATLIV